jgi:general secretion pathway protein G
MMGSGDVASVREHAVEWHKLSVVVAVEGSPGVWRLEPSACVKPANAGFTLIELIITVAILAILALGLLPLTQLAAQRAKEHELRAALRDIRTAIDAYKKATEKDCGDRCVEKKADASGYPPELDVLVEGVKNTKSPDGAKIYFMRRLPRDPFSDDPDAEAAKTWGLRSYESPPDDPKDGDDVFDVYSLSKKTGLNGVPYKEW